MTQGCELFEVVIKVGPCTTPPKPDAPMHSSMHLKSRALHTLSAAAVAAPAYSHMLSSC
jgi:hypothetical protein